MAVGTAAVAVLGFMWQAVLIAVLAWHRPLQCDLACGRHGTPDRGLQGKRALLTHEGLGLFHARLWLGSALHVDGKSDHTRASLARYDADHEVAVYQQVASGLVRGLKGQEARHPCQWRVSFLQAKLQQARDRGATE